MQSKTSLSTGAVALISLSGGAQAGIVYQDLNIDLGVSASLNGGAVQEYNYIDFNNDGITDFQIRNYAVWSDRYISGYSSYYSQRTGYNYQQERSLVDAWGLNGLTFSASPLSFGDEVSNGTSFTGYSALVDDYFYHHGEYQYNYRSYSCGRWSCGYGSWQGWRTIPESTTEWFSGSWADVTEMQEFTGFLGFQFNNNGSMNYGWLSLTLNNEGEGSINSFAYNDVAGQSIEAGQQPAQSSESVSVSAPGTLALMALGMGAICARRKKAAMSQ